MASKILTLDRNGLYVTFDRSHLFVVDCLPSDERSVRLKDDIQDIINSSDRRHDTQYNAYVSDCISDFRNHLNEIALEFEKLTRANGLILHIEAHGKDFDEKPSDAGIEIGDDREFVRWVDLQPAFSRLYDATQGKLTLIVSACWGRAALASVVGSLAARCAPFHYLIAPNHKATNAELEEFWGQLYRALYNDTDIEELLRLHSNFSLLSIEQFLATYALGTGREASDQEAQGRIAESGILMSLSDIHVGRKEQARKLIREFLRIDRYPHLMTEMDVRTVGTILDDHEMIVSNAREEDWK